MPLYSATSPLPVNRIKNRLFDPDARAFFATASVTDRVARGQINSFVIGVKALGLYNNMVCWPFRSTQNAGTGTTAYSLGGLGIYNGTLIGSPIRNLGGLNFLTGNNASRVSVSPFVLLQPFCFYCCMSFPTSLAAGGVFDDSATSARLFNFTSSGKIDMEAPTPTLTSTASFTNLQKTFISAQYSGATSVIGLNNSTNTGNAGIGGLNNLIIGNNRNINYGNKNYEIAFCMFTNTSSLNSEIFNLYKTTLGQGLGLP
jgi:hypothetical protein